MTVRVVTQGEGVVLDENVRVVSAYAKVPAHRSKAQQRRDEILTESEALLHQARELVDEALENLSLLMPPQHRNLSTLIGQQIEQVIEFRRVAG